MFIAIKPKIGILMTKRGRNPQVDAYLRNAKKWGKELAQLRGILLGFPLAEELKWGKPCYTFQKSNLIILYRLKESCALGFLKGALLQDAHGVLTAPGPNSQSARWAKFTSLREIVERETVLKALIGEAIAAEKAGLKVNFKKDPEPIPVELQKQLDAIPALKTAFHALTPGRQRGYILYFSAAKQSKTRESRIAKSQPRILQGKGLTDR